MSAIAMGEVFPQDVPDFQLRVSAGTGILWRDLSTRAEIIIWEPGMAVPSDWKHQHVPWKVIGNEEVHRQIWSRVFPPLGSRPIVVNGDFDIQVSLKNKSLRWSGKRRKRVLIVDDSATLRKLLRHIITQFGDWEILGELETAEELPAAIERLYPDLVTLDLNLPGMNGVQAMIKHLAPRKVPTLLITSQPKEDGTLVMDALSAGALDYIQKPESGKWDQTSDELKNKMEAALKARWQSQQSNIFSWRPVSQNFTNFNSLIAIGSSTGGTQALQDIFLKLPKNIPPILVTQHIPPIFSKALADRLNSLCPFEVKEASDGDEVKPGRILIAPGGHHMRLSSGGKFVRIDDDEPINRFRPSVDALFMSVSKNATVPVTATILTGMGKDGAQGLLELRRNGAYTIAQDEASSIVFGMPKEAINIGAALKISPLNEMAESLIEGVNKNNKKA